MDTIALNRLFQIASVLLGLFTALSSIGLFITQSKIDVRREERLSFLGPRELTEASKILMLKAIGNLQNQMAIRYQIFGDNNSIDSRSFANQIAQVLNAGGLLKDDFVGFKDNRASQRPGVTFIYDFSAEPFGLNVVKNAFLAGGIEFSTENRPFQPIGDHTPPVLIAVNPRF